jgi:hypothetical protein
MEKEEVHRRDAKIATRERRRFEVVAVAWIVCGRKNKANAVNNGRGLG